MFLIFPSRTEAEARSHGEAMARGCMKAPEYTTWFWWPVIDHPTDGRTAVDVGDETIKGAIERAALDAEGWFVEPELAPL